MREVKAENVLPLVFPYGTIIDGSGTFLQTVNKYERAYTGTQYKRLLLEGVAGEGGSTGRTEGMTSRRFKNQE